VTGQEIVVRVGDGTQTEVAPGGQIEIPIVVDMGAAGGVNIASLTFELTWDPTLLSYVSATAGQFGTVLFNDADAASGSLLTSMFNATGTTSTFTVARIAVDAAALDQAQGTWITISVTAAGNELGESLMGSLSPADLWLCISAGDGFLGDVTDDGQVNIIDAQQWARYSVGLPPPPVTERAEMYCDVTEDGVANIIDAQQIARHSVNLSTPGAPNIGDPVGGTCPVPQEGYDIELVLLSSGTSSQTLAFTDAVNRWVSLIVGDVPDNSFVNSPLPANLCGVDHPSIDHVVDDLLIFAILEAIDGPGGTLGSAGPCVLRPSSRLSVVGVMRFDTADLTSLEANDQLGLVVLHEMAHVMGFGIIWDDLGFLVNPSLPNSPGVDTHFDGPLAIAAFDVIGGTGYTAGAKVPVENSEGSQGTRDSHWRESVFDNELMTGFLNTGANPLSVVTVESFADIGYEVDPTGTDQFALNLGLRGPPVGPKLELLHDIWRGPLYVFEAVSGRFTIVRER
jgi:hypothetical protein